MPHYYQKNKGKAHSSYSHHWMTFKNHPKPVYKSGGSSESQFSSWSESLSESFKSDSSQEHHHSHHHLHKHR